MLEHPMRIMQEGGVSGERKSASEGGRECLRWRHRRVEVDQACA